MKLIDSSSADVVEIIDSPKEEKKSFYLFLKEELKKIYNTPSTLKAGIDPRELVKNNAPNIYERIDPRFNFDDIDALNDLLYHFIISPVSPRELIDMQNLLAESMEFNRHKEIRRISAEIKKEEENQGERAKKRAIKKAMQEGYTLSEQELEAIKTDTIRKLRQSIDPELHRYMVL